MDPPRMASITNDDVGETDNSSTIGTEKKQQPVVSLLEKYSSLHRGIDEARKECAEKELEIESIERDIGRLVEVDRPATEKAITTAIEEKENLLQTLETLTTKDLVDAREKEFSAQSNLAASASKEKVAERAINDDRVQYLLDCQSFRNTTQILSLRGKLFGLKIPVAPLSAYAILRSCGFSDGGKARQKGTEYNTDADLQLILDMTLDNMDSVHEETNWDGEEEDDKEDQIDCLQRQLQKQKESTERCQKVFDGAKKTQFEIQQAHSKRNEQKKELQSQFERLQRDVRGVESQIDSVKRQTKEANESAIVFQNRAEQNLRGQTSGSRSSSRSISTSPMVEAGVGSLATDPANPVSTKTPRKKTVPPYNPYAQKRGVGIAATPNSNSATNNSRTISPTTSTKKKLRKNPRTPTKRSIQNPGNRSRQGTAGRSSSSPPTNNSPSHNQHSHQTSRIRSSRHFGGTSFRVPGESLLKIAAASRDTKSNDQTNLPPGERGQKRDFSLTLEDTDDDDDDDDDDSLWLNGPTFSSSSNQS